MPNIPSIPGTGRIQSGPFGVKQNPAAQLGALDAQLGAIRAGVGAVQDVTGVIAQFEEKKQQAEELAAFNQASILTRKTTSAFRDSLRDNPNDREWVGNWQKTAQATREQILADPALGTASKEKMGQVLDAWEGNTTAEFTTAADIAGSHRRKRIGMLAADEALKDGNEGAATAAIDGLVRTGDMFPEEGEKLKTGFTSTIQENQIRTGMMANPVATLKDIDGGKFSAIPKGPLVTLRRQTEAEISRQQGEGRDDLSSRIDGGEVVDENEIAAKEKAGSLSPAGAKSIRARIAQKGLQGAKDEQAIQLMLAHEHDFTTDKEPDKTAQQMKDRAAGLPPTLRAPVSEMIDTRLAAAKKAGVSAERPVQKEVFDRMKEDREENGLTIPMASIITEESKGFLGMGAHGAKTDFQHVAGGMKALRAMSDEDIKKTFGDDATLSKVQAAEELHYAQQQQKMREWFKGNPEATDEQAEKYRQQLERPYIMAGARQQILKKIPTTVTTQEEFDALPSGAPFIHNGRVGTKN